MASLIVYFSHPLILSITLDLNGCPC